MSSLITYHISVLFRHAAGLFVQYSHLGPTCNQSTVVRNNRLQQDYISKSLLSTRQLKYNITSAWSNCALITVQTTALEHIMYI